MNDEIVVLAKQNKTFGNPRLSVWTTKTFGTIPDSVILDHSGNSPIHCRYTPKKKETQPKLQFRNLGLRLPAKIY